MHCLHAITIDGPAAAGKSTLGGAIADLLGWACIDTGVLYRAVAWLVCREQVDPYDEKSCATLASTEELQVTKLSQSGGGVSFIVLVCGQDITGQLRMPSLMACAPIVAAHSQVRAAVTARLRDMAARESVILVGRDCGTVVLPDADLKIYLTASLEERAQRRYKELYEQSQSQHFPLPLLEQVRAELQRRDGQDWRQLRPATDALMIETDHLSWLQVRDAIIPLLTFSPLTRVE